MYNLAAKRLHTLVSSVLDCNMRQLKRTIQRVINNLSRNFLSFKEYRFEIINSGVDNISSHQVAVNFFSVPMVWHDSVGDFQLVSAADNKDTADGVLTHLVKLHPFLSIYSSKEN